jgi:hypothetical protein
MSRQKSQRRGTCLLTFSTTHESTKKRDTKLNPSVLTVKHTPPTVSGHVDISAKKDKPPPSCVSM